MRKIFLGLVAFMLASPSFAISEFYTYSEGANGRISVTVSQGNAKLKWSEPTAKMSITDPTAGGFALKLNNGSSLSKGACTDVGDFENCPAVQVDSAIETIVEYSVSGGLEGVGDGSGSGIVVFTYKGTGANVSLVNVKTVKLANMTFWGQSCTPTTDDCQNNICPACATTTALKVTFNAFCENEGEGSPCTIP